MNFPPQKNPILPFEPLTQVAYSGSQAEIEAGLEKLKERAMGTIILAGGQGSRLGFPHPKGMFELAGKSLFERFCQKIGKNFPVAIMTSKDNDQETRRFFEAHHFFGFKRFLFLLKTLFPF